MTSCSGKFNKTLIIAKQWHNNFGNDSMTVGGTSFFWTGEV
jgi:hypothetical protein